MKTGKIAVRLRHRLPAGASAADAGGKQIVFKAVTFIARKGTALIFQIAKHTVPVKISRNRVKCSLKHTDQGMSGKRLPSVGKVRDPCFLKLLFQSREIAFLIPQCHGDVSPGKALFPGKPHDFKQRGAAFRPHVPAGHHMDMLRISRKTFL